MGGFSQEALTRASVLLIGAGGLNGQVADGLARKGIGRLVICDGDDVELSNLNRTPFTATQVGQPKPYALAEYLVSVAVAETEILAIPWTFQGAVAVGLDLPCDVAICGGDNDEVRVASARWARARGVPLIILAVTYNADFGYCFVQESTNPSAACYGCLDPAAVAGTRTAPCVVGSAIDVLKAVAGPALYAVDSLLMDRPRAWTYKEISLDGTRPERQLVLPRAPRCPLCGNQTPTEAGTPLSS